MFQQLIYDPAEFGSKIHRRTGRFSQLNRVSGSQSRASLLERAGHLTAAANSAGSYTFSDAALRYRLRELAVQFSAGIPDVADYRFPDRDPRVLYVVGNSLPHTISGYSNRSHSVALSAVSAGVDMCVLTRIGYPSVVGVPLFASHESIDGVQYRRSVPWVYPLSAESQIEKSVSEISKLVKAERINVLHTTTGFTNAIPVARVAGKFGIPWIYEVRGELEKTWLSKDANQGIPRTEESEYFRKWRAQETRAATAATRVIALSEISKQQLVDRGVEEKKIWVIPNSVDSSLLDEASSPTLEQRRRGLRKGYWLGTVTSVVDYEGLDIAVRSLPNLSADICLLIVGDGEARPQLQRLAVSLGVAERVVFVGRVSPAEAREWYKAMNVFIVPRRDVPVCRTVTPIKPLAAMGLSIPVIAADLPALREVTGDCAVYFSPDSVDSFVERVREIRAGGYDSLAARRWVTTRTWEKAAEKLAQLYTGALPPTIDRFDGKDTNDPC